MNMVVNLKLTHAIKDRVQLLRFAVPSASWPKTKRRPDGDSRTLLRYSSVPGNDDYSHPILQENLKV
jgi:hypothetical protein